jgi:hypothetical protein
MGIGRRQFMKLMGVALAGLTIDPLQAVAINSNYYVNKKLGLILSKPDGWNFVSVMDFGKLQADQVLADDYELKKEEALQQTGKPTLVIAKYGLNKPEYEDQFSPSITIFIDDKAEINRTINKDTKQNFEYLVNRMAYRSSKIFKDYHTIREIRPFELSNCNSFDYLWSWTFESNKYKKAWTCKTWSVMVEKGNFLYAFNMTDSEEAGEVDLEAFTSFVQSIKII